MSLRAALLACLVVVGAMVVPTGADAATETLLRPAGMGPLTLGMNRATAVKTDWLADRSTGCELGGRPYPITYRLSGPDAPDALDASAEFTGGRLTNITATGGVRTTVGVRVGTTVANMLKRYRAAGYTATAQYVDTFDGTFVTVTKHGKQVLGGFATDRKVTMLGVPSILVCE